MFNLLPDSIKDEIRKEYKTRRVILTLALLFFIQVSFLISLFPSWLVSVYRENDLESQVEKMNESPLVSNINSSVLTITETNTTLKTIGTALEYPKFVPIFNTIVSKKTGSIQINAIMYTPVGATQAKMSIGGISSTREALVSFVKNLENSKVFKNVDLPVSNLAKDKNIDFSINLSVEL